MFRGVSGEVWRRRLSAVAETLGLGYLSLVPRCLRAGGCAFLHLVLHWGIPSIVARGRWARYESTHSYLQVGLYTSALLQLGPETRSSGDRLCGTWPCGLTLPVEIRHKMTHGELELFRGAGGMKGWGRVLDDEGRSGGMVGGRAKTRPVR